jgi:hypothetical protein
VLSHVSFLFIYSVVECFPSRGAVEITNPNAKDSRESKKSFQYDAVYDLK